MRIASGGLARDVRLEDGRALFDGAAHAVRLGAEAGGIATVEVDDVAHRVRVARRGDRVFVWCDGGIWEFGPAPASERAGQAREDLVAPMTGRIRKLLVAAGERVEPGRPLVVLEAMKMEHTIRAPRAGTVRDLPHAEGDLVDAGTPLVEIG